ncbi:hypothetical protein EJ07DRAFT_139832, partial [Lizonia empirigonia]
LEIPKTMSHPADTRAHSFLTTFPPKIRNTVYEVLFRRYEPVLLHDFKAYYPMRPLRFDDGDHLDYNPASEDDMAEIQIFRHHFGQSLSILRCCCQIHHESAAILYGKNTFVITRALQLRHVDNGAYYVSWDQQYFTGWDQKYSQLQYALRWLSEVGSQIQLLQKVVIDVDSLCPSTCRLGENRVDLLPLLSLFWTHPGLTPVVKFGQSGKVRPPKDCHVGWQSGKFDSVDHDRLNSLLDTLFVSNTPNFKQHSRSRILDSVFVELRRPPAKDIGSAYYYYHGLSGDNFDISQDGKMIMMSSGKHGTRSFVSLPQAIQTRILGIACYSPFGITFDLDARTIKGLNMSLLQINRHTRWCEAIDALAIQRIVCVNLKISSHVSSLDHLSALQSLLLKAREYGSANQPEWTIKLNVNLTTDTELAEIKIDISELIRLSLRPRGTKIRISLTCPRGRINHQEEIDASLDDLEQAVYLLLCDVIKQRPTQNAQDHSGVHPTVWMNGRGELVGATFREAGRVLDTMVEYRHGHLSQHERISMGYRALACVDAGYKKLLFNDGSIISTLVTLHKRHWPDYPTKRGGNR